MDIPNLLTIHFARIENVCQKIFVKREQKTNEQLEMTSIKPVVVIGKALCKFLCTYYSFIYIFIVIAPKN